MKCEKCGALISEKAKFCENCGAPTRLLSEEGQEPIWASAPTSENEPMSRVQLFPDGKYRWTYDLNLVKNPTVFIDLIKVFGVLILGLWLIVELVRIRDFDWDGFMRDAKGVFWISVFWFFLCLISYLIVVRLNKGYYHLMFIMDENGITHCQREDTAKKGRGIAAAAVIMDTDNAAAAVAALQTMWTSRFPKVRRVKTVHRRHLIKVNEILTKNRIYVENPEDYEFVLRYIVEHCPRLEKE